MRSEFLSMVKMAFIIFWVARTYKTAKYHHPEDHDKPRLWMFVNMWKIQYFDLREEVSEGCKNFIIMSFKICSFQIVLG